MELDREAGPGGAAVASAPSQVHVGPGAAPAGGGTIIGTRIGGATTTSGTISTAQGPIAWSIDAAGGISATGGGQQFSSTGGQAADGSIQRQSVFAKLGQQPYLSVQGVAQQAPRTVTLTITAGESHLALAITGIDPAVTSGTATVSGSLTGSPAVNWTGPVDLTTNPLLDRNPIPGWPLGAFSSQWTEALFFGPFTQAIVNSVSAQASRTSGQSRRRRGVEHDSVLGWIGRGLAWGVSAACATGAAQALGTATGLGVGGFAAVAACGFVGYAGDEGIQYLDSDSPTEDNNIVINIPDDDVPLDQQQDTQGRDDPPPPPPGDPGTGDNDDDGGGGEDGEGGGGTGSGSDGQTKLD